MMRGNFYAVKYNKLSFDDYILEYFFAEFCMNIPLMSAVCANDKAVLIKHSYISLWLVSHSFSLSHAVSLCYVGKGGLLRSCNHFVLSEY